MYHKYIKLKYCHLCIWRHISPRFQTYIHLLHGTVLFLLFPFHLPRNIKILFILQCHFFFLVLLIYCCFMWLSITFFLFPLSSLSLLLFYVIFFQLYDIPRLLLFFFSFLFLLLLSSSLFRCCLEGAIYVYAMGIKGRKKWKSSTEPSAFFH